MPRLGQQFRRPWWWAAIVLTLIAGAGLLWEKSRLSGNSGTQLDSAYSQGDWEKTSALARERLKESPHDVRALRLAARAAARQDQDQKSIAIYERLDTGSKEAEDFFLLGRAFVRSGKIDRAFKAFEAAREKDPDHPEVLAGLAGLYLQSDRNDAAAACAQRLARQPQWEARAQLLLGTARSANHDPAGAAEALRRWAELDPEGRVVAPHPVAEIRKLLARSWLEAGVPAKAQTVLETVLGAGPDPEASWLLSRCFIQEKEWKRAAAVLEQQPNFRADHPLMPEPAPHVGEARCAACHREEFDAVLASRHATTFTRAAIWGGSPCPRSHCVTRAIPRSRTSCGARVIHWSSRPAPTRRSGVRSWITPSARSITSRPSLAGMNGAGHGWSGSRRSVPLERPAGTSPRACHNSQPMRKNTWVRRCSRAMVCGVA